MLILLWVVAGIIGIFVGIGVGVMASKVLERYFIKKINENAVKFLQGKRENVFDLDGKKMDVNRFIVMDDSGKETLIVVDAKVGVSVGLAPEIKVPTPPVTDIKESKDKTEVKKDKVKGINLKRGKKKK